MVDRLLYRGAPRRLDGRYRVVGGLRLYERVAERPGSPTVVLVHGVGVSGRYLLPTAGRLAAHVAVAIPDLPGFGRSAALPGTMTVARLAGVLADWLESAGIARASLLANSFGCQVAVALAAERPERVERLVLAGPTLDRRARSLGRHALRLAADLPREPLPLWVLQAVDYALHTGKSGFDGFRAMTDDAIEGTAARVAAPTLVVRGGRDPIVPRRWAEELVAAFPDARLSEIPGAPHAVNYSAPDELARLALAFLATDSNH